MRKIIKASIAVVIVVTAGFATYQSHGVYGTQDNSLLIQNVEALAYETEELSQLQAHQCNTFGAREAGTYAYAKQKAYICSDGYEITKESAVSNQTKCSYYGYKRFGGAGEDNKHWCVY